MNAKEVIERRERLRLSLARLDNQINVFKALRSATQYLAMESGVGARGDALLIQLAQEIVVNCEAIWELSGPDRVGQVAKKEATEEGRDETIPW